MPTHWSCGAVYDVAYPADGIETLSYVCPDCEAQENGYEEYDEQSGYHNANDEPNVSDGIAARVDAIEADGALPDMHMPSVTRPVSCEYEATRGIQRATSVLNYMSAGANFQHHSDATCDGELVFSRLQLRHKEQAHLYSRSLAALQLLHQDGELRVGMRAGHHIHVAARDRRGIGFSPNALVALYSVYCHCEDLLYRLAAAGWSRHRSELDGEWSKPLRKLQSGQVKNGKNIGAAIGNDKYQGVNVSPYLENIRHCRCGAYAMGDWQSCECSDERATIEWRLWNACVSPRKIRAYIAISHTLTQYASEVDAGEVAHLDERPFQGCARVDEDSLGEQLNYLLTRPGFDERDREDIRWLASISPGMGELATDYRAARRGARADSASLVVA